jgi:hypothetical protein
MAGTLRWRPLRRRDEAPAPAGDKRLRRAAYVCGAGFVACALGSMLNGLLGSRADLVPWLVGGAFLFALLPMVIMHVHMSRASDLSPAQKEEWYGFTTSGAAVIAAFFYLVRGGTALPPGATKRWRGGDRR